MNAVKRLIFGASIVVATGLGIIFLRHPTIEYSVVITRPAADVFAYLSDNRNAPNWSVYFDHFVTTTNGSEGGLGATRRCFRRADEQGVFWDEEITSIRAPYYRQLRTYNTHGYGTVDALVSAAEYKVEQVYEELAGGTRLTFRAQPNNIVGRLVLNLTAYQTRSVFQRNMENIRANLQQNIARPHPYDAHML